MALEAGVAHGVAFLGSGVAVLKLEICEDDVATIERAVVLVLPLHQDIRLFLKRIDDELGQSLIHLLDLLVKLVADEQLLLA